LFKNKTVKQQKTKILVLLIYATHLLKNRYCGSR